jgi:hypothetical protein
MMRKLMRLRDLSFGQQGDITSTVTGTQCVRKWGRSDACSSVISSRPRRGFLSAVHGLGGGTSAKTEAGSAAAGALTATDAGLQPAILSGTENQGLDSTTRAGSFQRMHQAKATGGAMSSLPAAVSQLPAGSRTLAPDVEAAGFRGGQEGASTRVLGRDTPLGDLHASGWDLAGGACTGAGANPVFAEQSRLGLRGPVVHGAGEPESAARDGASAADMTDTERSDGRVGGAASGRGRFRQRSTIGAIAGNSSSGTLSEQTAEGLQPLTNGEEMDRVREQYTRLGHAPRRRAVNLRHWRHYGPPAGSTGAWLKQLRQSVRRRGSQWRHGVCRSDRARHDRAGNARVEFQRSHQIIARKLHVAAGIDRLQIAGRSSGDAPRRQRRHSRL